MTIIASATFVPMFFATMFDDFRDRLKKQDHPIALQVIPLVTWKEYLFALLLGRTSNFTIDGTVITVERKGLTIRN